MKLFVDEERCQGHGRCYAIAPELFTVTDDWGHSAALGEDVPEELAEDAKDAVDSCPERAIRAL
jgi:ferredoxin